jgi:biotin carboxyl carrier protein
MKARVRLAGVEIEVELDRQGRCWRWRAGGVERSASVVEVEPAVYSVLAGERSYEARVSCDAGRMTIRIAGRSYEASVADPRAWRQPSGVPSAQGRESVTAPMPGRVVRVLVAEGDRVESGQGLVVVEAMKMQNEIQAPKAGRVVALPVETGAAVAAGDVLAAVE